jgi:hypothetical protein
MAGGIFGDRPFTLNPKCILFALVCMGLFLIRPTFQHPVVALAALTVVFWVAYIAMAWYDYYFNCDIAPLRKGEYSLQGWFKPPAHAPSKQSVPTGVPQGAIDASRDQIVIYLLHLVFIVPLIATIAILGRGTPRSAFWLLGATALLTVLYHSYALYAAIAPRK